MLASGVDVAELIQPELAAPTQPDPSRQRGSLSGIARIAATMMFARVGTKTPEQARRRIGALAAKAKTGPEAEWVASIGSRLPDQTWPQRRLLITAVDVDSGEFRVFDRDSGVNLASAVAASCSVPGIFPPVTIDGRRYMDGGMRSIANADLAVGCDPVLILVPVREGGPGIGSVSQSELEVFGRGRGIRPGRTPAGTPARPGTYRDVHSAVARCFSVGGMLRDHDRRHRVSGNRSARHPVGRAVGRGDRQHTVHNALLVCAVEHQNHG
jgi:predicted acylesterase/phospholipase RssA